MVWFLLITLLVGKCFSVELISCKDPNGIKNEGNHLCKVKDNYDRTSVPRPLPLNLDSRIEIYDISDIDEVAHSITIHFKIYLEWYDVGLSYHNISM